MKNGCSYKTYHEGIITHYEYDQPQKGIITQNSTTEIVVLKRGDQVQIIGESWGFGEHIFTNVKRQFDDATYSLPKGLVEYVEDENPLPPAA